MGSYLSFPSRDHVLRPCLQKPPFDVRMVEVLPQTRMS